VSVPGARAGAGLPSRDAAIRTGSKSFAMAARLFDPATRGLVWDLYTWCRHCDDVVDGQTLGHDRRAVADRPARLEALHAGTSAAFAGTAAPGDPFGALGRVVTATGLPRRLADDHLAGFAMDVHGRSYRTMAETLDYCYHVAGVVGLMMAWVMGVRDRAVLARASDLGMAFQLSNIARDVGDDALAGRVYLPADRLRAEGAVVVAGAAPGPGEAAGVARVVATLLDDAERYYDSAWHGIPHLPWRSAWAVATARLVYRDIGRAVRRRGGAAWASRTVVPTPRKLAALAGAGLQVAWLRVPPRPDPSRPARAGLFTPAALDLLG
jgi:phytoene synthase